jgi:E1A/CREB-binding protein
LHSLAAYDESVKLLKQRDKTSASNPEWLKKLPQMVKQLEVSLYKSAPSFEAYCDVTTLKQRLQRLAQEIGDRPSKSKSHPSSKVPGGDFPGMGGVSRSSMDSYGGNGAMPNAMNTAGHGRPGSSQSDLVMQQQQSRSHPMSQRGSVTSSSSGFNRGRMVDMEQVNPGLMPHDGNVTNGMGAGGSVSPAVGIPVLGGNDVATSRFAAGSSNPMMKNPSMMGNTGLGGMLRPNDQPEGSTRSGTPNMGKPRGASDAGEHSALLKKQQRLLLLHHSSKCPFTEEGKCEVPDCMEMKRLWKHMAQCKDHQCHVPHCFSSRSILSHYKRCKDQKCDTCGPVRQKVRQRKAPSVPGRGGARPGGGSSSPLAPHGQYTQHSSSMSQQSGNASGAGFGRRSMEPNPSFPPGTSPNGVSPMNSRMPPSFDPTTLPQQQSKDPMYPGMRPRELSSGSANPSANMFNTSPPIRKNVAMPQQQHVPTAPMNGAGPRPDSGGAGGHGSSPQQQDTDSKVKIKQQRLLLLRHASKCTFEDGKCPITPNCTQMKKLWKHIADCKQQKCTVPHCMSSRYVLSHYRKCKDPKCQSCEPVREAIRKQQEHQQQRPPSSASGFSRPRSASSNQGLAPGPPMHERRDPDGARQGPPQPLQEKSELRDAKRPKLEPTVSSSAPEVRQPPRPGKTLKSGPDSTSNGGPTPKEQEQPNVTSSEPQPQTQPVLSSAVEELTPGTNVPLVAADPPNPEPVTSRVETPKPSDDHSLVKSFTLEQIEMHIASLNRMLDLPPSKLKTKCLEIVKGLQNHQHGWVFNVPVDPVELGLPDYFDVIKRPMDLGTIQKRLEGGNYHHIEDFHCDVNLTFENAMTYNAEGSVVHTMAKDMKTQFVSDYKKLLVCLKREDDDRRKNEKACTLCGCEKLLFEPPVYFCNGLNCQSSRIRRNSHYYVGGNNQYFWCNQCYTDIKDDQPIELIDMTIKKSQLKKKKNDEIHEESWVQCDTCEKWIHQICSLFNTRQNKEHQKEYSCPECLLKKRKVLDKDKPSPKPMMAEDLARTRLSHWLEEHVRNRMKERASELIEEKAEIEKVSLEEAKKKLQIDGEITIRQVTSMDQKVEVREFMKKRYKDYPSEFPYRCKCLVVFQNLDGVDVVLFALYVYEHGEDNAPPNQRVVYISYLDSVHFMRPRKIRTFIYHEILIAYVDYVRRKGFSSIHIWACPPLKGDDYIFYSKPKNQKTPRDDRLRQWYIEMLVECQKRSIVGRLTNMYDEYFHDNKKHDATILPYLEGDYFPGEAENIIKELEEGGGKKKGSGAKKSKKKNGNTANNKDTAKDSKSKKTRASSCEDETDKSCKSDEADPVMVKLGDTIKPMKESFIVAYLLWDGVKEDNKVVPKAIEEARKERKEKEAARSKKRDSAGQPRSSSPNPGNIPNFVKDSHGRTVKVIDDDGEDLDCEFFNNRQSFLNLCRGNHYQFDELRRAKHTSMMVLWHLHNRDAPKFVQQCAACSREIVSGTRHHCPTCTPDFDLCGECFKNPKTDRGQCNHKLEAISIEAAQNNSGSSQLTAAQRAERQRSIQLHIQLLEHASGCISGSCKSTNCQKMKGFLKHERVCKLKANGGCKICKRIWTLLRIHAQQCKSQSCHIPQCNAIRERIRQIQKQQQAMDDRRRQEMNRHYRHGAS